MRVRLASPDDSAEVLRMYAHYISTPITFECELPTEQVFAQRMADICQFYPYLVCEEEGALIAYAYAHRYKERQAYQWNAELSIYVHPNFLSKGLGKKLYTQLMALLRLQGIKTAYACVTTPNAKSEALHASLGFQKVGTYHQAGYKAEAWHNVTWYEKALAPYTESPQAPVPLSHIPAEQVARVLAGL